MAQRGEVAARAPDFVLRRDRRRCLWIGGSGMPAEVHQVPAAAPATPPATSLPPPPSTRAARS